MPLFFKRPRTNGPTPLWLRWAVVGVIGMALIARAFGVYPHAPISLEQQPRWDVFSLGTYAARVLPGYGALDITIETPGSGAEALCGQEAHVRYAPLTADKNAPLAPLTFRLGDDAHPEALTASVLGMKIGETRLVRVPRERTGKEQDVLYRVMLEALSAALPLHPDALPLRAFDTALPPRTLVQCGSTVKARLVFWSADGKKKEVRTETLTLGAGAHMLGLEHGMVGMAQGGKRTLLVPPALQTPLHASANSAMAPISNTVQIIDVELLP